MKKNKFLNFVLRGYIVITLFTTYSNFGSKKKSKKYIHLKERIENYLKKRNRPGGSHNFEKRDKEFLQKVGIDELYNPNDLELSPQEFMREYGLLGLPLKHNEKKHKKRKKKGK